VAGGVVWYTSTRHGNDGGIRVFAFVSQAVVEPTLLLTQGAERLAPAH